MDSASAAGFDVPRGIFPLRLKTPLFLRQFGIAEVAAEKF
jgi:hypothetical protein